MIQKPSQTVRQERKDPFLGILGVAINITIIIQVAGSSVFTQKMYVRIIQAATVL